MKMVDRSRKTISVDSIKKLVNKFLAKESTLAECRYAEIELLEKVLFDTGNYRGYQRLEGVVKDGEVIPTSDDSRRFYY